MSTAPPAADRAATAAAAPAPEQDVEGGPSVPAEGGEWEEPEAQQTTFPPYPPYAAPAPPSVADAVIAGHGLRRQHKAVQKKSVRPLPRPARPKFPKATDVKMSRQAMRAHARCLRRHGAVLTDRLEYMSKPRRRNIICFWRENAATLPADTIARLRSMLDADEPFKPDQAYAYFVNLRKTKKRQDALERARVRELKQDINSLCSGKKFIWARNAAVAFARGVQQRLSKPGRYVLSDGMLRLSNIILSDICGFMKMRRIPSRRSLGSKANFMMEMSDKVAVWIDEILSESDDRMLMMDFDEDDDVALEARGGGLYDDDDYGDGPGGRGGIAPGTGVRGKRLEKPAYLKLDGNMRKAFDIITQEMHKKGDENLLSYGNFVQSYQEAAKELKHTPDLNATEFSAKVRENIWTNLKDLTKDITPEEITPAMRDMLEICSNELAQNAEHNKIKGPLFKMLIQEMRKQPNVRMYEKGKIKRTNAQAAKELESAKSLQDADHDDPILSENIFSNMKRLVSASTPRQMKKEMDETLEHCSKYLSQKAVDDNERGPAFDVLIKELETHGDKPFCDYPGLEKNHAVAYVLKSAPGLKDVVPEPANAADFKVKLHRAVDPVTPSELKTDMKNVIDTCSDYLSAYKRDRGPALALLLDTMKANPKNVVAQRDGYKLDYETGAAEVENAPALVPYLPVKDIAAEGQENLTKDMAAVTPPELKSTMLTLIRDVAKHLSQMVALRSGAAGDRYKMSFLGAIEKSLGSRPLFKHKSYGQTYADASDDIPNIESTKIKDLPKETVALGEEIHSEMNRGIPTRLAPAVVTEMESSMDVAAMHLAKTGVEKGEAMDYVVNLMKEKDKDTLANLQGYDQSYGDAARRLEQTPTVKTETIDIGAAATVKEKLTELTKEKPDEKFQKVLPEIIEDSANFLAAPIPETHAEKKQVLADIMGREGDRIIAQKGAYKQTFQGAGEDIKKAPVGEKKAHDEEKRKEIVKQIEEVMPDKKMEMVLKESTEEGAAYLTDAVERRGMTDIATEATKESGLDASQLAELDAQGFNAEAKAAAEARRLAAIAATTGQEYGEASPPGETQEQRRKRYAALEAERKEAARKKTLEEDEKLAKAADAERIRRATGGLDASQLAELDAQGFNAEAKAAAEARRLAEIAATTGQEYDKTSPPGETQEQRRKRYAALEAEKKTPARKKTLEEEEKLAKAAEADRIRRATGGLDASQLAELDAQGFNAEAKAAAEARRLAAIAATTGQEYGEASPPGETQEQRRKRYAALEAERKEAAKKKKLEEEEKLAKAAEAEHIRRATGGLDASRLAELDAQGFNAEAKAAAEARRLAAIAATTGQEYGEASPPGETQEQRRKRYAALEAERKEAARKKKKEEEEKLAKAAEAERIRRATGGLDASQLAELDAQGFNAEAKAAAEARRLAAIAATTGQEYGEASPPGETQEQRRKRYAALEAERKEAARKKKLEEEEKLAKAAEAERIRRAMGKYQGGALGADYDPEHTAALDILHEQLQVRGAEVLYEQPPTTLTHQKASEWLNNPDPVKVINSVKQSPDTGRLQKKFERKFSGIVKENTPETLHDAMQDVVIEGGRKTSEFFVTENYKSIVEDGLVRAMQKRGSEVLVTVDGAAETNFFAAQRLKRKDLSDKPEEPNYQVANEIAKKLDDVIRSHPMPRKVNKTMKEHVKDTSKFLSAVVTKPDEYIEAYVALLEQMDDANDTPLIEGVPKTCKESAD